MAIVLENITEFSQIEQPAPESEPPQQDALSEAMAALREDLLEIAEEKDKDRRKILRDRIFTEPDNGHEIQRVLQAHSKSVEKAKSVRDLLPAMLKDPDERIVSVAMGVKKEAEFLLRQASFMSG